MMVFAASTFSDIRVAVDFPGGMEDNTGGEAFRESSREGSPALPAEIRAKKVIVLLR